MYDKMSNKRRNTEGVVSIMTNPFVMFNVSASFCTARALLWCAPNAPAQIGHAAVNTYTTRERERDVVELLSDCLAQVVFTVSSYCRCSLAVSCGRLHTDWYAFHSVVVARGTGICVFLIVQRDCCRFTWDRDMCFLDRAT